MELIFIADIVCLNFYPGSESSAPPLLYFRCWHCLHELLSRKWVICIFSAWFPFLTLPAWTPIQYVSHLHLLCLISIPDIAWMNFYPGSESSAPPLLDFHSWHCLHELLSRKWVICTFSALFPLLTLPAWTPIQYVSHLHLLCFISIADIVCMNSYPGSESSASSLLGFHSWHCLHELLSREWVICTSFAWFPFLTLPAWTPIQFVSHLHLLCLISIPDIACMNSYPGSESSAPPLLDFHSWHCLHELLSSLWVICTSSALFPFLTLLAWTPIQDVSHLHLLCLISILNIACINSYPGCESSAPSLLDFHSWHCLHELLSREWVICTFFAWFSFLTLPAWTPIQGVSHLHLCLVSIPDIACMNSYPASESSAPLLYFHSWHCLYELLSSKWVICTSAWFPFLMLPVWTSIQFVSHVGLFLDFYC